MTISFPFNGSGRLGTNIIDNSVDAFDFVDNTIGNSAKHVIGEMSPVCCHPVGAGDGTEGDDIFLGTCVSHDTDCFYR